MTNFKLVCLIVVGQVVMAMLGIWFIWPLLLLYFWATARPNVERR